MFFVLFLFLLSATCDQRVLQDCRCAIANDSLLSLPTGIKLPRVVAWNQHRFIGCTQPDTKRESRDLVRATTTTNGSNCPKLVLDIDLLCYCAPFHRRQIPTCVLAGGGTTVLGRCKPPHPAVEPRQTADLSIPNAGLTPTVVSLADGRKTSTIHAHRGSRLCRRPA